MQLRAVVLLAIVVAIQSMGQDTRISPHATLQVLENEQVVAMAFVANDKILVAGDGGGMLSCWDLEKKILLSSVKHNEQIVFLSDLGHDRLFVAVDEAGKVVVFDMLKGATETSFMCKGKPVNVALDAGKQFLAVATNDERIELFDLKALMPAGAIDARDKLDDVLFLGFDRLAQQLVAIRKGGEVVSWNPATLKVMRELSLAGGELHGSTTVVHAAATNRSANVFGVGLEEIAIPKGGVLRGQDLMRIYLVIAYDWNSGLELKRVKTNWAVERMVMGPGNDHLSVTNDEDKTVSLIDLRKGEVGSSVQMEEKPIVLAVSEENKWLAAGTKNGTIVVWSMKFKEGASVRSTSTPALAGRIRSRSGTEPALKSGVPVKLALLGFEAKGVGEGVAEVCASSIANALANVEYITLVERRQIARIIEEQKFQLSGLTEEEGIEVGKISKADVVLLGNVGKLGSSLILSARLISVTTGKVLKGREVICEECRDQDLYDAISMLVSTIAQ